MIKILFTISFLLSNVIGFSQSAWELVKDKNGIKVYTATHPGSKYKAIKVNAVMPGTLDKLEAILMDPSTNKKWIYRTKECYLIKRVNANEIVGYIRTYLPWPTTDRDVTIKTTLKRSGKTLKVISKDVTGFVPVKKGVVRIDAFDNTWNVTSDGKGNLKIEYFLKIDPGGNLPAWVSNTFVAKGPFETFDETKVDDELNPERNKFISSLNEPLYYSFYSL